MTESPVNTISPPLFCGAARKHGESDCRRPAGWGTNHPGWGRCKLHGGSTQNHTTAVQIAQARHTAQLFGVPREVHPIEGLLEEYWRTAGLLDVYEAMCMQLLPTDVTWGVQAIEESVPDGSDGGESMTPPQRKTKSGAGVNLYVKLLNEERDRFARLGVEILKLDLAARQVEYTQSQVAALVSVLLAPELGLTEDQRRVAARLLRALDRPAIEGEVVA